MIYLIPSREVNLRRTRGTIHPFALMAIATSVLDIVLRVLFSLFSPLPNFVFKYTGASRSEIGDFGYSVAHAIAMAIVGVIISLFYLGCKLYGRFIYAVKNYFDTKDTDREHPKTAGVVGSQALMDKAAKLERRGDWEEAVTLYRTAADKLQNQQGYEYAKHCENRVLKKMDSAGFEPNSHKIFDTKTKKKTRPRNTAPQVGLYRVVGADRDTGADIQLLVNASSEASAEAAARKRGVYVTTVELASAKEDTTTEEQANNQ